MSSRNDVIPEQYKGIKRYSFSEIESGNNCNHAYYLSRIAKVEDLDNIYGIMGNVAHDILEEEKDYDYNGQLMKKEFLKSLSETVSIGFKFSSDESKHESMLLDYKKNVCHYFDYYKKEEENDVQTEYRVWTWVGEGDDKKLISGFVDKNFIDNEGYHIIKDYKTSSMYTKADLPKKAQQLQIYGKDLIDKGIPIDKIKLCWDFIKYTNITCIVPKKQKIEIQPHEYDELISKGIIKSKRSKTYEITTLENHTVTSKRTEIGVKFKATLRKILNHAEYDEDIIEKILSDLEETNKLSSIPNDIVEAYKISFDKCIMYAPFDLDVLPIIENEIYNRIKVVDDIIENENYEREPVQDSESYYCSMLCGVNHACKYYRDYMDSKEIFINSEYRSNVNDKRSTTLEDISVDDLISQDLNSLDDLDSLDIDLSDLI